MIVKCEQCQTRFKIPDEKVTDKGVKVRCTKCGATFRVTRDMAQPASSSPSGLSLPPAPGAPPRADDPFAKFGTPADPAHGEPTRPGVFALGVEATRHPELGGLPPFPTGETTQRATPAFDFSNLVPPAKAAPLASPPAPPVPAAAAPAPFDFSSLVGPTEKVPAPFDFTALAPTARHASPAPVASTPAMDFSAMTAPPPPPPAAPQVPKQAPPAAAATPAFDFSALGSPPAPMKPQSSAPFEPAMEDLGPPPPRAPERVTSSRGLPAAPAADDFFGAPMAAESAKPSIADGLSGDDARNALFDMAAALPPAPADEPAPAPEMTEAAPMAAPLAPSRIAPSAEPQSRRHRTALGIVVNVVIAAVLVVGLVVVGSAFLNEGKVSAESLSLEHLKATLAPSSEFVASDISNGLYETKSGRAVFFVRGVVENRGTATTKVVVKAEIVEGDQVVRTDEAYVAAPPTPEELFTIATTEDVAKLNARLAETRAVPLAPGVEAPFVVTFFEYPPDLKGFRVRVTARAVAKGQAAAVP